jgi:hypothetical protein
MDQKTIIFKNISDQNKKIIDFLDKFNWSIIFKIIAQSLDEIR